MLKKPPSGWCFDAGTGLNVNRVGEALDKLDRKNVVRRIWEKDYTVWKPEPAEITNRLGWLTVAETMKERIPALRSFAQEIRSAGYRHVVVLGMGGSSLGAEVFRQTFGISGGYPELVVLDSTVPERIRFVSEAIDPSNTLFIVSSKSGTTTEPLALYSYFRNLVESCMSISKAGENFIAITDAGTPLESIAASEGFRHVFINPADIGGRYSVLSYFGLVPAVLTGVDIEELLARAEIMRKACEPGTSAGDNPGAWLGASLGTLALQGKDKLTFITSPSVAGFGLWAEQLIAESIGKDGRGIIPVAGEPVVGMEHYGEDRLFVYLRLYGDDNSAADAAIRNIKTAGKPVITLEMRDKYDLGAEFFRWEFATAVAGAILGIQPFNQPDVKRAKDATEEALRQYLDSGYLPDVAAAGNMKILLSKARKGAYLAVMAYLGQSPRIDMTFVALRRRILERCGIATTLGYGPRYLHSTGQLHKGGPRMGLFLQITGDHEYDIAVPGKNYTFGVVADAQALGDLRALLALKRKVIKVHLKGDKAEGISRLIDELSEG